MRARTVLAIFVVACNHSADVQGRPVALLIGSPLSVEGARVPDPMLSIMQPS